MAVTEPTAAELSTMYTLVDVIAWAKVGGDDPANVSSRSGSPLASLGCDSSTDIKKAASVDPENF